MESSTSVMLVIHIIAGFASLITGFLSMLNRKGSKRHKLTGKIFFIGMTAVFITSIFISIVKSLAFLFMVAFFSYYLACSGYRILYRKKINLKNRPQILDWVISLSGLIVGCALIIFSIGWFRDRGGWGFVPLTFGLSCCINGYKDLKSFFVAPASKTHWLSRHGARMGGSFAATLTAFVVVNFSLNSFTWVLWILPGVLTGIWIAKTIRGSLNEKNKVVSL